MKMVDQSMGSPAGRTPWHLWLVGGLALLWNGYGAYDYVMTNTQGEAYLRGMGFTDAQLAYFNALPAWATAVWAIGVWGGLLGAILLLVRRRLAYPVFALSFLAIVVNTVYALALSEGAEVMGSTYTVMTVVIAVIGLGEVLYARAMARRGVLR